MKLKNLYIRDFGIFRHQRLEGLDSDINIIGGFNRAGKTTFLNILRYLGYGFPKKDEFPPAANKYDVEAEVLLEGNSAYNLLVKGYGDPKLNFISGKDKLSSIDELYTTELFTYHQLFTITLDELKKIPEGTEKKTEKLQSLLLGAGLGEIMKLPQLKEKLEKRSYKIGGKNGKVDVWDFKPYYNSIKKGLKKREEAKNELEEFNKIKNNLNNINEKISNYNDRLISLKFSRDRLDLLKNNYSKLEEIIKMNSKLDNEEIIELGVGFKPSDKNRVENFSEQYKEKLESYKNKKSKFEEEIEAMPYKEIKEKIEENDEKIQEVENNLSGLEERVKNLVQIKKDHLQKKDNLISEAEKINNEWNDEKCFEEIKSIKIDLMDQNELDQIVLEYNQLKDEIKEVNEKRKYLQDILNDKKERYEEINLSSSENIIKKYLYLTGSIAILGLLFTFLNPYVGLIVAGFGFVGSFFYSKVKNENNIDLQERLSHLKEDIEDKKIEVKKIEEKITVLRDDISQIENKLNYYKKLLDLDDNTKPELIKDYFREVRNIKSKVTEWRSTQNRLIQLEEDLQKEFINLNQLLTEHGLYIKKEKIDLNRDLSIMKTKLNKLFNWRELIVDLNKKENELNRIEEKIYRTLELEDKIKEEKLLDKVTEYLYQVEKYEEYINLKNDRDRVKSELLNSLDTDRGRTAFEDYQEGKIKDKNQLWNVFLDFADDFISEDDINHNYKEVDLEIDDFKNELEDLKNQRQSLKDRIEDLRSSGKLKEAQKIISENRRELGYKAEEYAVNLTASYILEKTYDRILNKMKDKLFEDASREMAKITDGEYNQILPPENLNKPDFQTVLDNGKKNKSTDILSRGTKEQLFFAVRLSRIRAIEQSLPVIVDDSLVNFDSYHLVNTLELISEISRTNQIFLLTCHPHLIRYLPDSKENIAYWKLKEGEFSKSNRKSLIEYLSYDQI